MKLRVILTHEVEVHTPLLCSNNCKHLDLHTHSYCNLFHVKLQRSESEGVSQMQRLRCADCIEVGRADLSEHPWNLWGAGQTRHERLLFEVPVFFGEPVHLVECAFEGGLHIPGGSVIERGYVRGEFTVDGVDPRSAE